MVYNLSPSSLNLFKDCPRCFWMTKHKVWKRPNGPFPSLPSGMDRILKNHFDNFRDQDLLPPELSEKKECRGMKLYGDKEKLKVWQNNFKGISYENNSGNKLSGALDNLLVKENNLVVLDYKTRGFALKEDTAQHYELQLDTYNLLLRKNGHNTEDYSFLLFYVPKEVMKTGEVIFDNSLIKVDINPNRAEKVWKNALDLLNNNCPKTSCEWCFGR